MFVRSIGLVTALGFLSTMASAGISVNGAGATFPNPIYSKWFSEYRKVEPSVEINYQSVGSGAGVRQLLDRTVDFGASDAPMTDEQLSKATTPVIHVPIVLGAVVITYNLPEGTKPLQLTSDVIADIFLGKIKRWDDAAIAKANAGLKLPPTEILVAHRSDGSGTTAVFADYLAKVSPEWKSKVGVGTSLSWPTGLGGKGNEGVTGLVKQTPGAIGYVELTYAKTNHLPMALLRNKAGQLVEASPATVTAAAAGSIRQMPKDFRVSITNAAGKDAYPISSFTYILIYQRLDAQKGPKIVGLLKWAVTDGQKMAENLFYAKLPKSLVSKVESKLKEVEFE